MPKGHPKTRLGVQLRLVGEISKSIGEYNQYGHKTHESILKNTPETPI